MKNGKSAVIQDHLKWLMQKIDPPLVPNIHKLANFTQVINWNNLWRIGHPMLRAIRYKVMLRDIYSKERLYRYKIADNDLCIHCNKKETVEHQIFECDNANRLWKLVTAVTGININCYEDILEIQSEPLSEVIICCTLKMLVQIDRSIGKDFRFLIDSCRRYLTYELKLHTTEKCLILMEKLSSFAST